MKLITRRPIFLEVFVEVLKRKSKDRFREKIYINGREFKSPLFEKKTDAKKWKSEMSNRQSVPNLVLENEKAKLTFGVFALSWLEKIKVKNSHRTYESYNGVTRKHLLPYFTNILIKDIKADHGDDLIKRLKLEKHNQKGVNVILAIFKRIINGAFEQELLDKNPLMRVKPLKEPPRNETYWTKHEISQFLRANLNDVNYGLYVVALNSGMRRGELAGLCWDRIDFERNQIEVSRTRDRYGLHETTKTGV